MAIRPRFQRIAAALALVAAALLPIRPGYAEVADLAQVPIANSPSDAVLPNLMYILDDSGSMAWNYMPDNIFRTSSGDTLNNCKKCTSSACDGPGGTGTNGFQCGNDQANPNTESTNAPTTYGEAPFYAALFNKIWYNPDITYAPGIDSLGVSLGNANPTSAKDDYYLTSGSTNLVSAFKEVYYCNITSPTGANLNDATKCRRNGVHNVSPFATGTGVLNYFYYWGDGTTTTTGVPVQNHGYPTRTFFNKVLVSTSNAHYFNIAPHEYCSDANLTTCALATATGASPGSPNTIPAPIRYCRTAADAALTTVVSGNGTSGPRCQKKYDRTNYPFPRYGRFTRVDIVASTTTYPKGPNSARSDCAGATSCTYAEEIQNFANWWTYYRTRMALMKTATGRAFLPIDDRFRIGFITINPNSPVTTTKYQPIARFDPAQRLAWYNKLYSQVTNGSTPNRTALHRVGRHYQGFTDGINSGMPQDPVEFSCQQNFALLTTDGYWNDTFSSIGNVDNTNSGYTTRAWGAYDGGLSGASSTLADVAAYYYNTDLRTTGTVSENNVPTSVRDANPNQHMVTFTLGLGLEGLMDYQPDYESSATGDFAKIKAGTSNACSWTTGTCNWPVPSANNPSTLDDLWHAAVNGRGKYFSAGDPNSLTLGLQGALAALNIQTAAASASATSSPNITETDNFIYSSTFRTVKWDGEIVAQRIDTVSGNVLPAVAWSASTLLNGRTTASADTRTIFTIDESAGGKRKNFLYSALTSSGSGGIAAERPYFDNKCSVLSQCALLTTTQKAVANNGDRLVNWLRGQRQDESFTVPESTSPFRARDNVLGDPVNATPAFMSAPRFGFADAVTPTYADFKIAKAARTPTLFIAANDGMLHALDGNTGAEMWAYVPRITMPRLHRIAKENWATAHEFTVDGSPQVMDAYFSGGWKTVLVAGLASGGRGYYALDVTDPASPKVLWEICSDSTLCAINDSDIGYTHGNPVITKRPTDGKWIVAFTSGLNNVLPGNGRGYLYVVDLATGAILQKLDTGVGDTTTPSGFNHVSAYADNFNVDNTGKYIYGGDLYGNVWKFDMQTSTPTRTLLAQLKDGSGKPQSVTSRPELALINGFPIVYVGTGRYLGLDDLVDPASLTPPNQWAYQQSLYAIKDKGVAYGNFRTGNVVQNTITVLSATSRSTSNNVVDWTAKDGWYLDFNPGGASPGERVNLDLQLVQGTLIVVTNVPNQSACAVGGDSWLYQFNYKNGTYVESSALGVAGTKFTGQITVGLVVIRLPSGVFKYIATGATGTKTPGPVYTGGGGGSARRISWRELIQR